ncbi:MAG: hypothetical protein NTV84_06765 [Methanoregula sp.]|nr:hypothetical protein [Methanoregula sp.]
MIDGTPMGRMKTYMIRRATRTQNERADCTTFVAIPTILIRKIPAGDTAP